MPLGGGEGDPGVATVHVMRSPSGGVSDLDEEGRREKGRVRGRGEGSRRRKGGKGRE